MRLSGSSTWSHAADSPAPGQGLYYLIKGDGPVDPDSFYCRRISWDDPWGDETARDHRLPADP